jgi:hypothetical protein
MCSTGISADPRCLVTLAPRSGVSLCSMSPPVPANLNILW